MEKKLRIVLIVLLLSAFSGCAYFNTFYNAKLYYKKGYEEAKDNRTGKITNNEKTYFNQAVDKSAKLIEFYPDSKYVDDAVLLMGKSYYFLQEYIKAERKFLEFISNYPNSEYLHEALLWQAKTHLALEEYDVAEREFTDLVKLNPSTKIRGEASYYLGKMYEKKLRYAEAVPYYEEAILHGQDALKIDAAFAAAASYDSLDAYLDAAEAYKRVLKFEPELELRFEARLKHGQMLKKGQKTDEAIGVFEKLLGEEGNEKQIPELRLEIADALRTRGDIDEAIMAYQDIAQEYEKKITAAAAYFNLGRLYERYYQDYDRAMDNYNVVREEHQATAWADSANMNARDILRFRALQEVIQMGRSGKTGTLTTIDDAMEDKKAAEEDTLAIDFWMENFYAIQDTVDSDTLARHELLKLIGRMGGFTEEKGGAFADSLLDYKNPFLKDDEIDINARRRSSQRPPNSVDWFHWVQDGTFKEDTDLDTELGELRQYLLEKREARKLAENPELKTFRVEEVDRNLFLLAELYRSRFLKPDSAVVKYRDVIENYPESDYAPRALYNLGYMNRQVYQDTVEADAAFSQLINRYPKSTFSNAARELLGLPIIPVREDTVKQIFLSAEKQLYDQNNPQGAISEYQKVLSQYGDSKWTSKALYSIGWVYENKLDSVRLAYVTYDSLIQKYPNSEYAKDVREKVEAVKSAIREKAEKAQTPELATPVESDSLNVEPELKKPVVREAVEDSVKTLSEPRPTEDRDRRRRVIQQRPGGPPPPNNGK